MSDNGRARRATMLDVAEAASVSYQTVSRVINDHPSVKPETRLRVQTAIRDLRYRPDKAARSLAARQSRTLAVITHGIECYGPLQMVVNIEHLAHDAGYDIITANIDLQNPSALDELFSWRIDGALMIASVASRHAEGVVNWLHGTPLIQIDNAQGAREPSVIIDQRAGGLAAAEHLIGLGHREIALISGPVDWFGSGSRRDGWLAGLSAAGLAPAATTAADWTSAGGYAAAAALLDAGHPFTALLVGNDQMALGAVSALKARGLGIPADVSVVGFDSTPESAYFDPPLTTVWQDFAALGQQGLEYLVELIQNPAAANGQRLIAPRLIVRASTAAR